MNHEIIVAGFGGQGILSAGRLLAYAGMLEDKYVSWLPSYGAEMRGGTANCHIVISDEPVGSPILNKANAIVVMNTPSLTKFESFVVSGGIIVADTSLVDKKPTRSDVEFHNIEATKKAVDLKEQTLASIILLGRLNSQLKIFNRESFEEALKKVLPSKKHHLIPLEMEAFDMGAEKD
jgi:2-oxoglutarate ferredoxin oxidoreductase subunit gamma